MGMVFWVKEQLKKKGDCLTKSSSSLLSLQHHKHEWQPLSKGGGILNRSGFPLPSSLRITSKGYN